MLVRFKKRSSLQAPATRGITVIPPEEENDDQEMMLFLSHKQVEWGDRCAVMAREYAQRKLGARVWYDMHENLLTRSAMEEGVRACTVFVLFASPKLAQSFALHELNCALLARKPIAVVVDTNAGSPNHVEFQAFSQQVHRALQRTFRYEGKLDEFKARLGAPISFHRHVGAARDAMFAEIHSRANRQFKSPFPMRAHEAMEQKLDRAEILLVAHEYTGMDQCDLIAMELAQHGVRAHTIEPRIGDETTGALSLFLHRAFSQGSVQLLLVFLTNEALLQPHVSLACALAREFGKKIQYVYEGNAGRAGAGVNLGEIARQAGSNSLLDENELLVFDQSTRRSYQSGFAQRVLHCAGLELPLARPQFDPFELPARKLLGMQPGSRAWFVRSVEQCSKPVLVFTAKPGMGKSVLMANLARRGNAAFAAHQGVECEDQGNGALVVGALHFFHSADVNCRSAESCLISLALQLCASVDGFRQALLQLNADLQRGIAQAEGNIRVLLKTLLIDPANAIPAYKQPQKQRVTILIDAMDECENVLHFCQALHAHWGSAPAWLFLVVSTRPYRLVVDALARFEPEQLDATANGQDDLREYLTHIVSTSLGVRNAKEVEQITAKLLELSEGSFLYVAMQGEHLVRLAEQGGSKGLNLESISALPRGLEATYHRDFSRLYEELGNDEDEYQQVLAVALLVSRVPMLEAIWVEWLGNGSGVPPRPAYANALRNKLSKILLFHSDLIQAPHKSVLDFLQEEKQEDDVRLYLVPAALQRVNLHAQILSCLQVHFQAVRAHVHANSAALPSLSPLTLTAEERFSLDHLVFHAVRAGADLRTWFLDFEALLVLVLYYTTARSAREGGLIRLVQDGRQQSKDSEVNAVLGVLQLGQHALAHNALELAGQVLARLDPDTHPLPASALAWVHKRQPSSAIALPRFAHSGLSRAGGMIAARFAGHRDTVYSVSATTELLLTCSSDGTCRVWDLSTNELIQEYRAHRGAVNCGLIYGEELALTASNDKTVRLWKLRPPPESLALDSVDVHVFENGHETDITSLALLCGASNAFASGDFLGNVLVWSLESYALLYRFRVDSGEQVSVACLSANKNALIVSTQSHLQVWQDAQLQSDVDLGSDVQCFATQRDLVFAALHDKRLCRMSPDGNDMSSVKTASRASSCSCTSAAQSDRRLLALGFEDNCARVYDCDTLALLYELRGGHSYWVVATAFHGSNALFTGAWDTYALRWNLPSAGAETTVLVVEEHSDNVTCMDVCEKRMWVATASSDRTMRVWDLRTNRMRFSVRVPCPPVVRLAFVGSQHIVGESGSDGSIMVWDADTGALTKNSEVSFEEEVAIALDIIDQHVQIGDAAISFTTEDSGTCWRKGRFIFGPSGYSFKIWELT